MIYEQVEELCKKKGISIRQLEQDCNIGNATVRGWKESYPRVDTLYKVTQYFGVSMDSLMENEQREGG